MLVTNVAFAVLKSQNHLTNLFYQSWILVGTNRHLLHEDIYLNLQHSWIDIFMTKKDEEIVLPYLSLIIAMVAISFSAIFIRWVDKDISPLVVGAYRQTFASFLFIPFLMKDNFSEIKTLQYRSLTQMSLVGIVLGLHFGFFISSVTKTSVAAATLLATSHPLFVVFFGWLLLKENVSQKSQFGIFLSFIGISILFSGELLDNSGTYQGNLFALISGILAGIYFLAGRTLRSSISLPTYAFVVYSISAVTLWCSVILTNANYYPIPKREVGIFLLMALIPTLLGHTLHNWALGYLPAYIVSITLLAEPFGASLLAWHFFNELPTTWVVLGGVICLGGIFVTLISKSKPQYTDSVVQES